MESSTIYNEVQKHYSLAAEGVNDDKATAIARAFGYSEEDLKSIPDDANLGLSCGNPVALASLREGETVVDLGSGAGLDVFISANKVGPKGRAIGIDQNKDMLAKANKNAQKTETKNVEFLESSITKISLPDAIADCVISNCVINLVPEVEKQLVFNEIFRILKPGGRVAISDVLAKRPLPDALKKDVAQYVGCIAGASLVEQYQNYLQSSGFDAISIVDTHADLSVYGSFCCIETTQEQPVGKAKSCGGECNAAHQTSGQENIDINYWVGGFKIYAVKAGKM